METARRNRRPSIRSPPTEPTIGHYGGGAVSEQLSEQARLGVQRVYERAARRLLDEQMNVDAPSAAAGEDVDSLDRQPDRVAFLDEQESVPVEPGHRNGGRLAA